LQILFFIHYVTPGITIIHLFFPLPYRKRANLEFFELIFEPLSSSRCITSHRITSHRIASHRIAPHREEGERGSLDSRGARRASGGGSATSVAARCSKTGPLRMRASSSLKRAWRRGGGRCCLLIPTCPTCRPCRPGASVAREPSTCGGVSPRSACVTAALSFSLSQTHTRAHTYTHATPTDTRDTYTLHRRTYAK
jgi:hypothetical protein